MVEANEIELYTAIRSDWDIWQSGSAGGELDPSARDIYLHLIVLQHWHYINVWNEFQRYGLELSMQLLVADIAAFLKKNPGARKTWSVVSNATTMDRQKLIAEYTGSTFNDVVNEALDKLDHL